MNYQDFLKSKALVVMPQGIEVPREALHPMLFDFQRDLVYWALRKGRAAIFAGTGLGKTAMQLVWANHIAERCLILAPLAVAQQTVAEGAKFGISVTYARSQAEAANHGITVTNYEMLEHFDISAFDAVVLDESSILKSFTGKTRNKLIEVFAETPYRLCCTATPAPNDVVEIGNHAEFLGIMSRTEMLAAFFTHDSSSSVKAGWRLKGHARQPFYHWLASWAMSLRRPSDLGYDDGDFRLPPLEIEPVFVKIDYRPDDQLFFTGLGGIQERLKVRRKTIDVRVQQAVDLIRSKPEEQWIAWVDLNDEGRRLRDSLGDECVLIEGSDSIDEKAQGLMDFVEGRVRVLVTKPSIAGFGMNMQNCHNVVYVGLSDSWERYYQSIRRCWRFGQRYPVNVYVVLTSIEDDVWRNIQRKEKEAEELMSQLVDHVAQFERIEIASPEMKNFDYQVDHASGDGWKMILGDSAEQLLKLEDESIDLTIYSPPFLSLYVYSDTERDLGNSKTDEDFWKHYGFISRELLRVTKPGRHVCVHVSQVPLRKQYDGVIGIKDFRGDMIRHMVEQGFIYHGEIAIDKNPQAQAIRTKNKGLLFAQLEKDSSWLRPAFADYILIFRKPGENAIPILPVQNGEMTRDDWIKWAHPLWIGLKETDTLNVTEARGEDDERHIAPLQLEVIERCIKLWSNPGELILDPFAGIGSTGYIALKNKRKFIGIELKPEYWRVACKNLKDAEMSNMDLFKYAGVDF